MMDSGPQVRDYLKYLDTSQGLFLTVSLDEQLIPGSAMKAPISKIKGGAHKL
jgi:hypothetical protein